jgi:2-dehydropantoate 2-reductase
MLINIIGKGAIGLLFAKDVQHSAAKTKLLVREVSTAPLVVTDIMGKDWSVSATQNPVKNAKEKRQIADILLVPVKAFQVTDALTQWQNCIGSKTIIVILCNGIGIESAVTDMFPDNAIVRGTTNRAALKQGTNRVTETGLGDTMLGWLTQDKANKAAQRSISNALTGVKWQEDVIKTIWQKVAINAIINPLTAIYDIQNGRLSEPRFQPVITELTTEIASLFLIKDIPLNKAELASTVARVITNTAENYSSMHQDIQLKKPTEIDFITGQLLSEAAKYGIMMPRNTDLYQQIKNLEANATTRRT